MATKKDEPVSLDRERTRKFLNTIAEEPFLAIVVTGDDEVRIFAKDLEPEHIDRVREALIEIRDG